jgi:Tfp pilus assembly protein PilO
MPEIFAFMADLHYFCMVEKKETNIMETPTQNQPIPSPNATRWLYILLAIFAVMIIGLSIWLISTKSNLRVLQEEKEQQKISLQREVDSLIFEHNQTKIAYGELADSLTAKDSLIQANAIEIKQLLNTKWEYYKIKKKLERLQVISQGYVRQMDSLYTVNRELTEENERIREEFNLERKRNVQLSKVKEELTDVVEMAAELRTFNVSAQGVRQRGSSREVETDKIRRVERVKICFTIAENKVVPAGQKTIYIRIAAPDNQILAKGRGDEYSFMHQGERLQYSIMETVDYQNQNEALCVYWDKRETQELTEGMYSVDIYEGETLIGQANFNLR